MHFISSLCGAVVAGALATGAAMAAETSPDARAQTPAQAPGVYRVTLGDFRIAALSDGTTPVSFDRLMHGISKEELAARFRDAGESVDRETSINTFLIDTGTHRILVDAGAGRVFGDCCGRLTRTLQAAGIDPASIDVVLLTHVHGDHSAGLTIDGQRVFPNADVYLAKTELDYWMSDTARATAKPSHQKMFEQARAALTPYLRAARIKTFSGRTALFPGITAVAAPGHTPGHSFYALESRGRHLLMVGDIVHAAEIQLPDPAVTVDFDVDEATAAHTRIAALEELSRTHELVAAPHISFPGFGHVIRAGSGYGWAPLPYSAQVREVGN